MSVQSYTTVTVSNPPKASELYKLGWNAFCNGLPYSSLQTADEKRGYHAASKRQAEYLTPGYADSMQW